VPGRVPGRVAGRCRWPALRVERRKKARVVAATRPANSKTRYRPWFRVCDALRAWLLGGIMTAGLASEWCSDDTCDGYGSAPRSDLGRVAGHDHGKICRARIAPADRAGVRQFLSRFDGAQLEVALEATTGWRFVVEELQQVGADVHLAEAAEASALTGKKQHAKTDWADVRHLRELLLIGRVPESWIPPAHLLDLRARVAPLDQVRLPVVPKAR
jgi:hypothetical protein